MSDGPEGQRMWKQGWRTRAPEFPVSGPSSPAFGAHPNSPSPHSSFLPLSRECHLGAFAREMYPNGPATHRLTTARAWKRKRMQIPPGFQTGAQEGEHGAD